MKPKKARHFLKLLAVALVFACLFSACRVEDTRPEVPDVDIPEDPDVTYTYKTEVDEAILSTNGAGEYLLLANKEHPLSESYAPKSLADYPGKTYYDKEVKLEERVAQALFFMLREMEADGVKDVFVTSGYRSYAYQKQLFLGYLAKEMNGISQEAYAYFGEDYIAKNYTEKGILRLNRNDAKLVVASYSAEAGYSEHQTGLCVDLITSTMTELDSSFETSAAFAWLSENAYRFGFILRYPEEKESVTGYSYEPWHYRFVGREAATAIYFRGLTLEEFLES